MSGEDIKKDLAVGAKLDHLAGMSPAEYGRVRKTLAEECATSVVFLDQEYKDRRKVAKDDKRDGLPPEPEPWPERVDGAQLLKEIEAASEKHLILPKGAATAISLWTVFAHAHDCFEISPILAATSPTPECGKTTLVTLLSEVTPRPLPGSNFSTAVIYRSVDAWSPTLIIDEGDTYLKTNPELRGILNSGHNRRMAWVLRAEGENFTPTRFSTWAPKVVALIGKLHPTLSSRSIHIELKRKMPTETVEGLRADRVAHLLPLRRKAMRWAMDNAEKLRGLEPRVPDFLQGRAADNWRPLLAVADVAGSEWPKRARDVAELFSSRGTDEVHAITLLADVRDILVARGGSAMLAEDIVAELVKMDDRSWPEWKNDRPITKAQVAKLMGLFDVRTKQVWANDRNRKGYDAEALKDAFQRYLPALGPNQSARPLDPLPSNELRGNRSARNFEALADEKTRKPLSSNGSSGLSLQKPLERGNGGVCAHCGDHAHEGNPIQSWNVDGETILLHAYCEADWISRRGAA